MVADELGGAQNKPVAAAVLRVFGPQLAEVPLVATRNDARRQGHARVLMRAIEARLCSAWRLLGIRAVAGVWLRRGRAGQSGDMSTVAKGV